MMFAVACGPAVETPEPRELVLHARTVDGLKIGAPVYRIVSQGDDAPVEIGQVVRLSSRLDQVEVTIRIVSPIQVFRATRFELARDEDSRRIVLLRETDPPGLPVNAGEKIPLEVPPETLEDRLWVAR